MNKQDVMNFINKVQNCQIATVEDGQPRVRGIAIYKADDRGIIFHTGVFKAFYKQLKANPRAEICLFDPETFTQVRVRGNFAQSDDPNLKEEIINAPGREYLKNWIEQGLFKGREDLAVFSMKKGQAIVWSMQTNFEPQQVIEF